MTNIVYVHAHANKPEIRGRLIAFYSQIVRADIDGLERIQPVLGRSQLTNLLGGQPLQFQNAVTEYPFEGLGIWTEWRDGNYIDAFYQSPLHRQFSEYAQSTLDNAWYRVIQLRDGIITKREVR